MLAESLLLAGGGGLAALIVGSWMQRGLIYVINRTDLQSGFRPILALDFQTLLFTLGVSILAAILLGILPSMKSLQIPVLGVLKQESGAATVGRGRSRLFGWFVVAQVAVSLVLLVGAGLMVRTVRSASAFDLGFLTQDLVLVDLNLRVARFEGKAAGRFLQDLSAELAALPQVERVSIALKVPLDGSRDRNGVKIEGFEPSGNSAIVPVNLNVIGPDYFRVMGIPVNLGRSLQDADTKPGSRPVVVVNREFATRYWPNQDPIGKHIQTPEGALFEVIGVAGNVNYYTLGEAPEPIVFALAGEALGWPSTLHLRTRGSITGLEPLIRDRIAKLNPRVRVKSVMSFEEYRRIPLLPQRALALTASLFGSLALALTLIGLYALISSSVIRRTREIGIRIALGGDPRKIQRMVLLRGMALVLAGIGVGLVAAAGLTQFLSGILFKVSNLDPVTYGLGAVFMIGVSLLASLLPARRTTRIDPVRCLRYE